MGVMRDFFLAFSRAKEDKLPPWGLMPWCVWGWTVAVAHEVRGAPVRVAAVHIASASGSISMHECIS